MRVKTWTWWAMQFCYRLMHSPKPTLRVLDVDRNPKSEINEVPAGQAKPPSAKQHGSVL